MCSLFAISLFVAGAEVREAESDPELKSNRIRQVHLANAGIGADLHLPSLGSTALSLQ